MLIEQQYIKSDQDKIIRLLKEVKAAKADNGALDVRIILGKIFNKKAIPAEKKNLKNLKKEFGLQLGRNIRYIDTSRFVHCHNKMIIVDGTGVLVSSQNWSNAAVSENREAGVLIGHSGIAGYFAKIFENDWKTAAKKLPSAAPELAPEALGPNFVRVEAGDFREV